MRAFPRGLVNDVTSHDSTAAGGEHTNHDHGYHRPLPGRHAAFLPFASISLPVRWAWGRSDEGYRALWLLQGSLNPPLHPPRLDRLHPPRLDRRKSVSSIPGTQYRPASSRHADGSPKPVSQLCGQSVAVTGSHNGKVALVGAAGWSRPHRLWSPASRSGFCRTGRNGHNRLAVLAGNTMCPLRSLGVGRRT